AGSQALTATDTVTASITGTQSGISVTAAAASNLLVSGLPASLTAGTSSTVTVAAKDASGNTVTGYTGTVRFTSSDGKAGLPADYTFTSADAGVHTFTNGVIFKTAGTQSVSAKDTTTAAITGTQSGITVIAIAPSLLLFSGLPASVTAGT